MKTIVVVSTKETAVIAGRNTEVELKTIDLLKIAINGAPEGGFTPSEMISRVRVLDIVEAAEKAEEDSLSLEDADFENLKKWVNVVKWAFVSRFVIEFLKQFN